ncbi:MAG: hypothetical protein JXA69_08915, partial [Phycisphaerae bacterium]|nr:hypothetical protein [Phycisphaerae bacterium]
MNVYFHRPMRIWLVSMLVVAVLTTLSGCARPQWFKGNTHTHTWWSDGNTPPEIVAKWYKDHGYDFLVLSDHNILSRGETWAPCTGRKVAMADAYEQAFDSTWIEKREGEDAVEYRLKTLDEVRSLYEVPGKFLLIEGEEITDACNKIPVHLNALNLAELIPPPHGETVLATMQNNFDAVAAQAAHHGRPMLCHLNHPNFVRQIVAEDIARLRDARFFEVYNGHP